MNEIQPKPSPNSATRSTGAETTTHTTTATSRNTTTTTTTTTKEDTRPIRAGTQANEPPIGTRTPTV